MPDLKKRAAEVNVRLARRHPDAKCALDFTNAFELLIATILSAQSTDARVNIVTKSLFRKYPGPKEFANADTVAMETDVKQTGFFRNKAKAVINCAKAIMERHGGEVPKTMEELTALPGVGRKTANVVLGNAYGINAGVVVDTHVGRVSGRLGFTENADPEKIEQDLIALVPQKEWTIFAHRLIFHGRQTCIARKPLCEECVVNDLCPSAEIAAIDAANDKPAKKSAPKSAKKTAAAKPAMKTAAKSRANAGAATADPASPASSRGRSARSSTPSSASPSRSRTLQSPRGRKPSRSE